MFKSNKGFTLVELIVVIAILAILAGVAIPVYNGYIKRANDAAVVTELDAIMTASQAANATQGQIVKVVLEDDGKTVKVAGKDNILAADFESNFILFHAGAADADANTVGVFTLNKAINIANTSYKDGATWTAETGKWEPDAQDVAAQSTPGGLGNGGQQGGQQGGTQEPALDAACAHEFGTPNVTKPATCADGEQKLTCTKCGGVKTEVITGSGNHTWEDADCENPKHCTTCNVTEGTANGHQVPEGEKVCTVCNKNVFEGTEA